MEHSWKLNTIALSVLAIILAYMGYTTLVFLILGFAVIALKDEELTKNILDVFLLTLVISIITSLLRTISNGIYNFFAGIVSDAALDAWSVSYTHLVPRVYRQNFARESTVRWHFCK